MTFVQNVVLVLDDVDQIRIRDIAKLVIAHVPVDADAVEYVPLALAMNDNQPRNDRFRSKRRTRSDWSHRLPRLLWSQLPSSDMQTCSACFAM